MKRRYVIFLLAASALALAVYWALKPRPVPVEIATVEVLPFLDVIEQDGRTQVRDRYLVSAPLSGYVQRLSLKAGDVVETGQELARIMPPLSPLLDPRVRLELEAQIGVAEAAVDEAVSMQDEAALKLANARSELRRIQDLANREIVATAQLETAQLTVDVAEREVMAAERRRHASEHVLEQARAALTLGAEPGPGHSLAVHSPLDGRVLKVLHESEGVVQMGTPLIELGDPADLEVAVDVLTTDAPRIAEGDKVIIERWGGGTDLDGVVQRVELSAFTKISTLGVAEQRVWVIIDITSPREVWQSLGDGYRVEVKIIVGTKEGATVVPVSALFRRGDTWQVFVVEDDRARLRSIQVDMLSSRSASVTSGVAAGDSVVLYPPSELADGDLVVSQ